MRLPPVVPQLCSATHGITPSVAWEERQGLPQSEVMFNHEKASYPPPPMGLVLVEREAEVRMGLSHWGEPLFTGKETHGGGGCMLHSKM